MLVFVSFYPFDFYINSAYSILSVCCFSFLFFFFYSVLYIYFFFTCIWTFVCNKLFIILSNRVEECQNDSKLLHKITSTLLINQHQITLPSTENDEELANNFSTYFTQKIDKTRENFTHARSVQDESLTDEELNCFRE